MSSDENKSFLKKYGIKASIMIVAVVGLVVVLGLLLNRYTLSIVVTNSMYPAIPQNTYMIMDKYGIDNIEVGDIIVYNDAMMDNVVHRVVEVGYKQSGEKYYKTKGDSNKHNDYGSRVREDIVGKIVYVIGQDTIAGKILDRVATNNIVIMFSIVILLVGIVLVMVYKIISYVIRMLVTKIKEKIMFVKHIKK